MLGTAFDTRPNALNAVRFVLAAGVLVWHVLLSTSTNSFASPGWQALSETSVDGFFAISGFLIVRSWNRRPDPVAFIRARLARLLPGLWLCLVVTAFVIAPLTFGGIDLSDQLRYVAGNAGVLATQDHIGVTPYPVAASWNLSLWSLWWELLCYVAVLGLGIRGLLRLPVVAGIAGVCWAALLAETLGGVWSDGPGWQFAIPRLGLMFSLGALAYLLRDRIPVSHSLATAAAVLLVASYTTPNYHLLGAPALAYLVLYVGLELGRVRQLRVENDLSYGVYVYNAPVLAGLHALGVSSGWMLWAELGGTVALAAVSWFAVERSVLRWVRGRSVGRAAAAAVQVAG
jgi:peptidoglycan/LPS O-acetylase OafA/YrhL